MAKKWEKDDLVTLTIYEKHRNHNTILLHEYIYNTKDFLVKK